MSNLYLLRACNYIRLIMLVCSSRKPSARCLSCASMSVMRDLTIDTCHKVTRFGYYPWAATVLLCVTLWSVCLESFHGVRLLFHALHVFLFLAKVDRKTRWHSFIRSFYVALILRVTKRKGLGMDYNTPPPKFEGFFSQNGEFWWILKCYI